MNMNSSQITLSFIHFSYSLVKDEKERKVKYFDDIIFDFNFLLVAKQLYYSFYKITQYNTIEF